MGIYPTERRITEPTWDEERQLYVWTEERNPFDGAKYRREVTATKWEMHERADCYCCSCTDYGTAFDAYCRNHGFAGERACEVHNLAGTGKCTADWLYGDEAYRVDLVKLRTVEQQRAYNDEQRARCDR